MESVTSLLNSTGSLSDITSLNTTIATIDKYMNNLSKQIEESITVQYDDIEKGDISDLLCVVILILYYTVIHNF